MAVTTGFEPANLLLDREALWTWLSYATKMMRGSDGTRTRDFRLNPDL